MNLFLDEIERSSKIFNSIAKEKFIRIFAHFDCDGICSASILARALARAKFNFSIKFLKQLTKEFAEKIQVKNEVIIFIDFGSGQIDFLKDIIEKNQVFIFDHHFPKKFEHFNLFHLNPLLFNEEEISASIVSYFFAKYLNEKNADLGDIAIVGAIGDEIEEKWKFKGLASKVLSEAESLERIFVSKGLRIYGRNKPLHKALASTFDPFIPGISGSENNAVQFLSQIPIQLKFGNEFRKLKELSFEEQKMLATSIILERLKGKEEESEDVFGNIYFLTGKPDELEDAREFATILNACGRMGNPEIGLELCCENYSVLNFALRIFEEYRKKLCNCLNFVKNLLQDEGKISYFICKDKVDDSIVGTITSMLMNCEFSGKQKILIGFANSEKGVKVSARTNIDVNLGELLSKVVEKIGGESGGHAKAAGAYIENEKEKEFIETLKVIINGKS